ncbi:hypothetical protein [Turneriella parva]|uniref:Uncharacterized protein n=1 Tax=Turneriella parva (strain ATCC BAA-1111 / DSM 21527 / NCTC 11395 / H) TaxID=869212 RepID=I4B4F0_TURPD|nr:hypothetical protein [Turneriella parva]AFM12157.1 hypothetical protein Turpa_1509 [Turneriella parva DSM 21527]
MKAAMYFVVILLLTPYIHAKQNWRQVIENDWKSKASEIYSTTALPGAKPKYVKGDQYYTGFYGGWCFNVKKSPSMLFEPNTKNGLSYYDFKGGAYGKAIRIRTEIKSRSDAQIKKFRLHFYDFTVVDNQYKPYIGDRAKEVFSREFETRGPNFEYIFEYIPHNVSKGSELHLVGRLEVLSVADNVAKANVGCIAELQATLPDQQ